LGKGVRIMELRRGVLVLVMGAVLMVCALPCGSAEAEKKDEAGIWTEGQRRGPGRRRFDLTDEQIDRIMKQIKETNPEKAKELAELRKKDDLDEFRSQLREHGGEELAKIFRERIESFRRRMDADFLEWLAKNYQREAKDLAKIKPKDPELYNKKFDLLRRKYRRIYEASRWNPELAKALMEDLELQKRRDDLIPRIKREKDEKKRNELAAKLQEVVENRFELIVRRKEIAFEHLLKRLKDLQEQINKSRADIKEWRNEKFTEKIVKERIEELTKGIPKLKFKWD